jgi:hypothetical protein
MKCAVAVEGQGLLQVAADAAERAVRLQLACEGAVDVGRREVESVQALEGDAHRRADRGTANRDAVPDPALAAVGFQLPAQRGGLVGRVVLPGAGELLGELLIPACGEQQLRVGVEARYQRVGLF